MKVYIVRGWVQYKTDVADTVYYNQLADSPEEAISDVKSRLDKKGMKFKLIAEEKE